MIGTLGAVSIAEARVVLEIEHEEILDVDLGSVVDDKLVVEQARRLGIGLTTRAVGHDDVALEQLVLYNTKKKS